MRQRGVFEVEKFSPWPKTCASWSFSMPRRCRACSRPRRFSSVASMSSSFAVTGSRFRPVERCRLSHPEANAELIAQAPARMAPALTAKSMSCVGLGPEARITWPSRCRSRRSGSLPWRRTSRRHRSTCGAGAASRTGPSMPCITSWSAVSATPSNLSVRAKPDSSTAETTLFSKSTVTFTGTLMPETSPPSLQSPSGAQALIALNSQWSVGIGSFATKLPLRPCHQRAFPRSPKGFAATHTAATPISR